MSLHVCVLALVCAAPAQETHLLPEEILAAYRQNASTPKTLRISWTRTLRRSEDWRKQQLFGEKSIQRELDAMTPAEQSGERGTLLSSQVKSFRALGTRSLEGLVEPVAQDYWSSGPRFQIRWFVDEKGSRGLARAAFPDDETTRATLEPRFGSIAVLSVAEAGGGLFHLWEGSCDKGECFAGIRAHNPVELLTYLPPLSRRAPADGVQMHMIDEFFSGAPEEYAVLAPVELDGVPVLLVERALKVERGDCIRAWIDPARGCLPLRIETYLGRMDKFRDYLKPSLPDSPPFANEVLRVSEIREAAPNYFYPVRGESFTYGEERNESLERTGHRVPHETVAWSADAIEIDRPMSDAAFTLSFPPGTVFWDDREGQGFVVGDADGTFERLAESTSRRRRPTSRASTWWIVGGSVLAAFVVAIVWWRRRSLAR
jgi:hypothetical protein